VCKLPPAQLSLAEGGHNEYWQKLGHKRAHHVIH